MVAWIFQTTVKLPPFPTKRGNHGVEINLITLEMLHCVETDRPFVLGVETFESTNFHGTRDSHHPSIFVRGSHRGGVWQGKTVEFPGEKKNTGL